MRSNLFISRQLPYPKQLVGQSSNLQVKQADGCCRTTTRSARLAFSDSLPRWLRGRPCPRCLLPAVNRRSSPPPSWRLALPPADRDQATHKRYQSNREPERAAVSRDEYAEGDEQADIHAKHHPALPRARRSPAPAITLRREL